MRLSVLVVDDNPQLLNDIREEWKDNTGVDIRTASTEAEAITLLESDLFVLCIVDLQLDEARSHTLEGAAVLDMAASFQPVAHLYAMTAYPELSATARTVVRQLLDPTSLVAHRLRGLIDKTDQDPVRAISRLVEGRLSLLGQNPVLVEQDHTRAVVERLSELGSVDGWANLTNEAKNSEVEHVISLLFGQGQSYGNGVNRPDRSVEIVRFDDLTDERDEVHTGNSGAAVYLARTQMGSGASGDWVVVKFGDRDEIGSEIGRYELFVRFDSGAKHRVELLGSAYGNHLAALCYSLAASAPEDVQTLRVPIRSGHPDALKAVQTLFSPEWTHWHGTPVRSANPLIHMQREFRFEFNPSADALWSNLERATQSRNRDKVESAPLWHLSKDQLKSDDQKALALPGPELAGQLSLNVPFCICHGDTHAANIMFNDPSSIRLIDYATTGPGPRTLDFATLEASQRILVSENLSYDDAMRCATREQELWDAVWHPTGLVPTVADPTPGEEPPFWMQFSATTLLAMRGVFPNVTAAEYAQVAILHGVRLSRVWWIDGNTSAASRRRHVLRLRLLAWMSPMVRELR